MATVASISASIKADITNFESGIKKARKDLKAFADDIPFANTSVSTFAATMAAAGSAGVVALTSHSMEAIDGIAKLSDRLGYGTEELVGYEHAARMAGIGSEQFKLAIDHLSKSGNGRTFRQVAEEISQIPNAYDRANTAADYFGKNQYQMVNVLLEGAAGLDKMREEAEKLGITFSRIDAAKVEMANDAFTTLGELIKGIANRIAIELSPFLQAGVEYLIQWGTEGEGMGAKVTNAFNYILKSVASLTDYFELAKAGWYGLQGVIAKGLQVLVGSFTLFTDTIGLIFETFGAEAPAFVKATDELARGLGVEATKSFAMADKALGNFLSEKNSTGLMNTFEKIKEGATQTARTIADKAGERNEMALGQSGIDHKAYEAVMKLHKEADKLWDNAKPPIEKWKDDMAELATTFQNGLLSEDKFNIIADKYKDEFAKSFKTEAGSATQIDNSLINPLYMQQKKMEVEDPALKVTNELLQGIKDRLGIGQEARTTA